MKRSTHAEVVNDNGRKLPKVPLKNGESVHYSMRHLTKAFKRLRTRR